MERLGAGGIEAWVRSTYTTGVHGASMA